MSNLQNEEIEQQMAESIEETKNKTINEKVKEVNAILLKGEPANVSIDSYSGYSGYKPQYIVDAMNAVFGIGNWGFSEISNEIVTTGEAQLAIANVSVYLEGIDARPVGYGQSRVTRGDLGDAKKGAQTDALKKALSYFSIGNRAFHGLLEKWNKKGQNVTR